MSVADKQAYLGMLNTMPCLLANATQRYANVKYCSNLRLQVVSNYQGLPIKPPRIAQCLKAVDLVAK